MNELSTLQTLRDDVPEPTPEELAPAFEKLTRAMNAPSSRRRGIRRAGTVLAGITGAVTLTLVAGNLALAADSAQTASALHRIAGATVAFTDPAPGQYLLSRTHADWLVESSNGTTVERWMNRQTIDVYMPADPDAEWVLYRDWGRVAATPDGGSIEKIRAKDGEFYGDSWLAVPLADIPRGSGTEALAYFDAHYFGGSASRDEDDFVRITGVLRSGLVPAELRAALFEALALIPGVSSTADVANLDGRKGIAIGRTELLRGGLRQEIIVDPETGLVIGERQLLTIAAFGFGLNEVTSLTAIETTVVDEAP